MRAARGEMLRYAGSRLPIPLRCLSNPFAKCPSSYTAQRKAVSAS